VSLLVLTAPASDPAAAAPAGGAAPAATLAPAAAAPTAPPASLPVAAARVERLLAEVRGLQTRSEQSLRDYDASLAALAGRVTAGIRADGAALEAERQAAQRQDELDRRLRSAYQAGGPLGLYASVLDADSPGDALDRVTVVQRVLHAETASTAQISVTARDARAQASQARAGATTAVGTVREVLAADAALETALTRQSRLLAAAQADLARVRAEAAAQAAARAAAQVRAAALARAAERAAARLAATSASARAATAARLAAVRPSTAPSEFFRLYRAAATTCPGLSWTVLAAVGQVESGHGRSTGVSSAGARGPMQFLPATFAAYGVDGDRDGDREIDDPADAVFSAARYLCASGAASDLPGAVFAYNRAQWYVELVLRLSRGYATGAAARAATAAAAPAGAPATG